MRRVCRCSCESGASSSSLMIGFALKVETRFRPEFPDVQQWIGAWLGARMLRVAQPPALRKNASAFRGHAARSIEVRYDDRQARGIIDAVHHRAANR